MEWTEYLLYDESTWPEEEVDLWYYFEHVGRCKGKFYGGHCFASDRGFLTADVTHWQYDVGQEVPPKPEIR